MSINRNESSSAIASETARKIDTSLSSGVARVKSSGALVDIETDLSVSRESIIAGASESAVHIFAGCFVRTVVSSSGALVNINAVAFIVLRETFLAAAGETTGEVGAVVTAARGLVQALVDVETGLSVASEAGAAFALESTGSVCAESVVAAVVKSEGALVDVNAGIAFFSESSVADTAE